MTLNELFARFDKLAAVRVLGLVGSADCGERTALLVATGGCGVDRSCSECGGPGRLGKRVKVTFPSTSSPSGKSLSEDQDLRRLLLLCVRAARGPVRPCPLLCGDGGGHDRGYFVSSAPFPGCPKRVPQTVATL
jgi:hypothetical protein